MEEKQINKWLRRQFSAVGWILLGYYAILNILSVLAMLLQAAGLTLQALARGNFRQGISLEALAGNAWGYILTVAVGLLILYAWKGWEYNREIFARHRPMTLGTLVCLICLGGGAQMANSLWVSLLETVLNQYGISVMEMLESVSGDSSTFSMFLYSAILAPISEEILFRGFIFRSLRPYGKRFAIFASAFLFGIFHGNLLQTPYAFLMGLILGYAAAEHSLLWAIVLHMFNNLVLADLMTRLLKLLPAGAGDMVSLVIFGIAALASLVLLVVRRREIAGYRRSEWMDSRCVKCFFLSGGVLILTVCMAFNMIFTLLA